MQSSFVVPHYSSGESGCCSCSSEFYLPLIDYCIIIIYFYDGNILEKKTKDVSFFTRFYLEDSYN
jgi:hypothetical protein